MHIRQPMVAAFIACLAIACGREPAGPPEQASTPTTHRPSPPQLSAQYAADDQHTGFQRSLMQSIAERRARGQPTPESVSYSFVRRPAAAPGAMMMMAPGVGGGETIEATTVVRFNDVTQAGLSSWPALVVRGTVPQGATGYVNEGDYTDVVRRQIAEKYPNANVDFDTGPRTYTITETITDASEQAPAPSLLGMTDPGLLSLNASGGILMGFTVPGPNLDYHIEYNLDVCVVWFFGCVVEWDVVDFWAGFVLDWTIAMRLPMAVNVTSPDPVEEGSTFTPITSAAGLDWSATDYEQAGVLALNGNEFVLDFEVGCGVFLTVSYVPVVDFGIAPTSINKTASFATPLGSAMVTLPDINVSVWNLDVALAEADFGVQLTPQMGSDRYTADWSASGGGGSGSVTYTSSGEGVALGSIQADDGPGNASVDLSAFRYHFSKFGLDLGLYFYLYVAGWDHTWALPITQFDLSGLMGGLYLKPHSGTPSSLTLLVPITNVVPTATISRTGSVMVGGQSTFLAQSGAALTFTGEATDPGNDDITLSWDWSNGAPSPDVSTTYTVPHSVSESQTHAFTGACLYQVALRAEDDDQAASEDRVPVIVTGSPGNQGRLEGYWQHQLHRSGDRDFDDATLDCYLAVAAHMSTVLGEVRDVGSIARAHDVLFLRLNAGDAREQFDRELLVAWLNFAHGAIGLTELVDTDGDLVPDTPFANVLSNAEAARLNPLTRPSLIREFTWMLHHISTQAMT